MDVNQLMWNEAHFIFASTLTLVVMGVLIVLLMEKNK